MKDVLYHYCGVESFYNIVESHTIRLSDVFKCNDYEECRWLVYHLFDSIGYTSIEKERLAHEIIESTISSLGIYAICLSEECDLLSQWRGYADNGSGVSIGFSAECFIESQRPYFSNFGKIKYGELLRDKAIKKIISSSNPEDDGIRLIVNALYEHILEIPFFKNSSFDQEKEWRFVATGSKSWSKTNNNKVGFRDKKLRFSGSNYRTDGVNLISYMNFDFSKSKKEFIKEIWIGPKSQLSKEDIRDFLFHNDYYDEGVPFDFASPILIQKSKSTYR